MTLKNKEGTLMSEPADMFLLHEEALEAVKQYREQKIKEAEALREKEVKTRANWWGYTE